MRGQGEFLKNRPGISWRRLRENLKYGRYLRSQPAYFSFMQTWYADKWTTIRPDI